MFPWDWGDRATTFIGLFFKHRTPVAHPAPHVALGALSDLFGGGAAGLRTAMPSNVLAGILSAALFFLGSRSYAADKARAEKGGAA